MKNLLYYFFFIALPFIINSQNYQQQNFLLPLEITGTHLIQEGVDFTIPENTILHMLASDGTIQYITNNYQNLECPCIIGPGNTVAHAYNNSYGILYYFDENSYVKPITINGEDTWNTWVVPENKFWYVLNSNFYTEGFNKGDILWSGREISTNESGNYFLAIEYDILAYNSSLSISSVDLKSSPILFPNPTNSKLSLNSEKDYNIEVFDLTGRKIMEAQGNNLDMSNLSKATYIVKIFDKASKETYSYKVIRN
jgi:hypothetical protein